MKAIGLLELYPKCVEKPFVKQKNANQIWVLERSLRMNMERGLVGCQSVTVTPGQRPLQNLKSRNREKIDSRNI